MSLGFQIVLWSAVGRVYAVPQPCRSPISVVSRSVESTQSLNLVVCPFLWSAVGRVYVVPQPCCSPISVVGWLAWGWYNSINVILGRQAGSKNN